MKKALLILGFLVLFTSLIAAESVSIEFPNGNKFEEKQPVTFKATIYDDSSNPVDGEIIVTVEDAERNVIIEKTASSREVSSIDLGERAASGQGVIKATYNGKDYFEFFEIGRKELARFELDGGELRVTNIGNTQYSKVIKITIGETTGIKEPELEIGESISYRLVAPEGVYNLKVTDGETSLIRSDVQLSGTGQVIGAIDNSAAGRSPFTGGISPDESSEVAILSYIKNNTFVYVFIIVIFGAMILIAIERQYRKRAGK